MYRVAVIGLPCTGNLAFAMWMDKTFGDRFHWVVNGGDPMPHLVPRRFDYQHSGRQIWTSSANTKHYRLHPGQETIHGKKMHEKDGQELLRQG